MEMIRWLRLGLSDERFLPQPGLADSAIAGNEKQIAVSILPAQLRQTIRPETCSSRSLSTQTVVFPLIPRSFSGALLTPTNL